MNEPTNSPAASPPLVVDLTWEGEKRFRGRSGPVELVLDSAARAGPSPVQALAFGLAGCMAIDVVHILAKGRLRVAALSAHLEAVRAQQDPRRILSVVLHFVVSGDVPPDKVERALALSREKYCSVWHSLRTDIQLETSFEIA